MKSRKFFNLTRSLVAGGFILGLCLLCFYVSATLIPQFESLYRVHRLEKLWSSKPNITAEGFAIDETMSEQFKHRDRLVALGVFFNKTYSPDPQSITLQSHESLVRALTKSFPDNHLWMLSLNNTLEVWDFKEKEGDWDRFAQGHNLAVHPKNDATADNDDSPER